MDTTSYLTVARDGEVEIEVKRSRFLCTLERVDDEGSARAVVERADVVGESHGGQRASRVVERPVDPGGRRGALILAYARFCRIGLWPARDAEEVAIKAAALDLTATRDRDPDPMRAAVAWASELGKVVTPLD